MRGRTGKIARLPGAIRHELNRRLYDGALGRELLPWLNALPPVQQLLAREFAGHPISHHNLSEWRRGGFQDWLANEERRIRLQELTSDQPGDSDKSAQLLAVRSRERLLIELAEQLERLSANPTGQASFKQFQGLSRELCRWYRARTREREILLAEAKLNRQPPFSPTQFKVNQGSFSPVRTYSHQMATGVYPKPPSSRPQTQKK